MMPSTAFDPEEEFLVLTHRAVAGMNRLMERTFSRGDALSYLVSHLSAGETHKLEPSWPTGPARIVLIYDWDRQMEAMVRLVSPTHPDGTKHVAPDRRKTVAIVTDFWEK